jgi:hypothetical protein
MQHVCNVVSCDEYASCEFGKSALNKLDLEHKFKLLTLPKPDCMAQPKAEAVRVGLELPAGKLVDPTAVAKMRGYTGDVCTTCQNLTMVRNGSCLKCDTCGSTTGCS